MLLFKTRRVHQGFSPKTTIIWESIVDPKSPDVSPDGNHKHSNYALDAENKDKTAALLEPVHESFVFAIDSPHRYRSYAIPGFRPSGAVGVGRCIVVRGPGTLAGSTHKKRACVLLQIQSRTQNLAFEVPMRSGTATWSDSSASIGRMLCPRPHV